MEWFVTITLAVTLLLVWWLILAAKGTRRNVDQLRRPIEDLLKRGFDGGTLVIEHTKSSKFLQFAKYIHAKGIYGIEMGFPNAEWSRQVYGEIKNYCKDQNYQYVEEEGSDGMMFLNVDFRKDTETAYRFTRDILLNIFGLSEEDQFFVRLDHASKKDVLIDQK